CRGNPLRGLRMSVYDVDLYDTALLSGNPRRGIKGKRQQRSFGTLLAETTTNACGEYCICYRYVDYRAREIDTADIRVVVGTAADQRYRVLQVSETQFNAPAMVTVDV